MIVRPAGVGDLDDILEIHNHAILHTRAIWIDDAVTKADREAWFEQHRVDGHPVFVAVEDDRVLGYGSYGWYRPRPGYRHTVENSVYLRPGAERAGVGRALMVAVIDHARAAGHHTMIAGIESSNAASIALHEKLGFVEAGRLREAGTKFGQWLDLVLMQLALAPSYRADDAAAST